MLTNKQMYSYIQEITLHLSKTSKYTTFIFKCHEPALSFLKMTAMPMFFRVKYPIPVLNFCLKNCPGVLLLCSVASSFSPLSTVMFLSSIFLRTYIIKSLRIKGREGNFNQLNGGFLRLFYIILF